MASIITRDLSVSNASKYLDSVIDENDSIYIAVGRTAEWTNENVPPTPIGSNDDLTAFKSGIIGITKVDISGLTLATPRVNWTANTEYNLIDNTSPSAYDSPDFYVLNSENRVYQVAEKTSDGILTVTEPLGTVTSNTLIDTGDGYKWRYLYDITPARAQDLLLETWMPVNYNKNGVFGGGTITEEQELRGDNDANKTLKVTFLELVNKIADEGTAIPYDIIYRQVGIILNPTDMSGAKLTGDRFAAADYDTTSGEVLYLDNKKPITRTAGQSEIVTVIIEF